MPAREVEWKRLRSWWTAITVDQENRVISLNLRDENNLIIYNSVDDEIYVDLQLPDWIAPTYAFPVGITTGRVLVADWWDVQGTLIVAKTTSGDNIKILYADNWQLFIDNWTGTFKQIYLKADVDALLAWLRDSILAEVVKYGLNKIYDQNTVVELGLWEVTQTGERSWHRVTLDPKWEVEVYNVTTVWANVVELGETGVKVTEAWVNNDYTAELTGQTIVAGDGTNTQTYNLMWANRIATLSDLAALEARIAALEWN